MPSLPRSVDLALGRQGQGLTILAVRLAAMGDILRTLPPVRLVRRALPRARIFWVLDDRWRSVLEGHPDLDGLIEFPRREWQELSLSPAGWPAVLRSLGDLRRRLHEVEGDLLLDFHGNLRSGLTGWLSGVRVRLGYAGHQSKEANRWFSTHHQPSGDQRTPRMERNLDLVRALGLPDHPLPSGDLPLVAAGRAEADRVIRDTLGGAESFAVISPGASKSQGYKRPPPTLLSAASRELVRNGVAALAVWGPGEEEDARCVVDDPGSGATMAPATGLPTLAALLHKARLFVGGDSGPLHLACAVGCPVVGVYGPTDPQVNRPWGVPYRTVYPAGRTYTGIKHADRQAGSFEGLLPRHVEAAVAELLEDSAAMSS